jgi:hypothetical protein
MNHYGNYEKGDWDHDRQHYVSGRKYGKPLGPDAPHIPNGAERKELARIMQRSGLSEEEVRLNKVHRIALAQARKEPTTRGTTDRKKLMIKRKARKLRELTHHQNMEIYRRSLRAQSDDQLPLKVV